MLRPGCGWNSGAGEGARQKAAPGDEVWQRRNANGVLEQIPVGCSAVRRVMTGDGLHRQLSLRPIVGAGTHALGAGQYQRRHKSSNGTREAEQKDGSKTHDAAPDAAALWAEKWSTKGTVS